MLVQPSSSTSAAILAEFYPPQAHLRLGRYGTEQVQKSEYQFQPDNREDHHCRQVGRDENRVQPDGSKDAQNRQHCASPHQVRYPTEGEDPLSLVYNVEVGVVAVFRGEFEF